MGILHFSCPSPPHSLSPASPPNSTLRIGGWREGGDPRLEESWSLCDPAPGRHPDGSSHQTRPHSHLTQPRHSKLISFEVQCPVAACLAGAVSWCATTRWFPREPGKREGPQIIRERDPDRQKWPSGMPLWHWPGLGMSWVGKSSKYSLFITDDLTSSGAACVTVGDYSAIVLNWSLFSLAFYSYLK